LNTVHGLLHPPGAFSVRANSVRAIVYNIESGCISQGKAKSDEKEGNYGEVFEKTHYC